ncbi:MAG: GAF domain-containing protein [Candidatus Sulfotelmatobacter sp.]|jgi:GAF domain-containing protein
MAAPTTPPQAVPVNRRRRFRHKVRTPAYASFIGESKGIALDLNAISDISEDGIAIEVNSVQEAGRRFELHLDLAESSGPVYTSGEVIWSSSGRCGLRFAELPAPSLFRLRSWLFLNAMTAVADHQSTSDRAQLVPLEESSPRPNYSDTLAALAAVQREVESLGPDLVAALQLIVSRAQTLVRATGAAIALSAENRAVMVCRASSGEDAPPVGTELQIGSGFSGECVRTGKSLRCDDAEADARVDHASCRALGIRSILAAPVRVGGGRVIGLIEAFSPQPNTFSESDTVVLQRLADAVLIAVNRAARAEDLEVQAPAPAAVIPTQGSVLFTPEATANGNANDQDSAESLKLDTERPAGIHLPQYHLIILLCYAGLIAGVIAGALGFIMAPWIQSTVAPWVRAKVQAHQPGQVQTVLASAPASRPDANTAAVPVSSAANNSSRSVDTSTLAQLRQLAEQGDPLAQNALGLRYAQGDGVKLNEEEAARWFTKAAEQGDVAAQSKLGSLYWVGRGVPASLHDAYFWTVLARAGGDKGSKELAKLIGDHMTRAQSEQIEQDANTWLQQHQASGKPAAGR